MTGPALLRSPLHDRHVALGARLADFSGWQMPIEYSGGGVVAEHTAVREAAGIFDVSHLGKARLHGDGAADYVNASLTADLARIGPGKAQYTMCCDDASGGVVDDMIAYLHGPYEVLLVPNAANTTEVVRRLQAAAPAGIEITNLHRYYGVIAVQGPESALVLDRVGLPVDHDYMSFTTSTPDIDGVSETVVCRTGYTGERGYELLPAWEETGALWDALLAVGAGFGVRPCGLGARDTLRTEMGYPLHGHDLSLDITPVQARAGWAVGWKKPAFWGREALLAERGVGPARLLWGLDVTGRGIPRPGMSVTSSGTAIGTVTSGTFSPTLRRGIALALLAADVGIAAGTEVELDIRGRVTTATVVKPPFVAMHVR
ncbi:MAG: glycine cleavage system aminomethyltransferase GcvT [Mycobacteriales bacterium]|nr:MAG: glycine cleavage system aminomethyltransferase GcvT [Pseudonocardiales bacterium]